MEKQDNLTEQDHANIDKYHQKTLWHEQAWIKLEKAPPADTP